MAAKPPVRGGKGGLGRKVGPLPVYGWILVVGGGLLVGLWLRHRLGSSSGAVATTPTTSSTLLPGDATAGSSGGSVGAGVAPASSGLDPGLEALVLGSQQALLDAFSTSAQGLTSLATTTTYAGLQAQQQSFDFATASFGQALDFVKSYVPTGGSTPSAPSGSGGPASGTANWPAPGYSGPSSPAYTPVVAHGTGMFSATTIASGGGPVAPFGNTDFSGHAVSSKGTRVGGALLQ